jgi:hypothetical protein
MGSFLLSFSASPRLCAIHPALEKVSRRGAEAQRIPDEVLLLIFCRSLRLRASARFIQRNKKGHQRNKKERNKKRNKKGHPL